MKIINILFYSIFVIGLSRATRSVQVEITKLDGDTIRDRITIGHDTYIKVLDTLIYTGDTRYICDNLIHHLNGAFTKPEMNSLLEKLASGAYHFFPSITYSTYITPVYQAFYGYYMPCVTQDPHKIIFLIAIQREREKEEPIKKEFSVPPVDVGARESFTEFMAEKVCSPCVPRFGLIEWDTDEDKKGGWSSTTAHHVPYPSNLVRTVRPVFIDDEMNRRLNLRKKLTNKPIPRAGR